MCVEITPAETPSIFHNKFFSIYTIKGIAETWTHRQPLSLGSGTATYNSRETAVKEIVKMGDRHLMIRDRALILRVLVPGLETRLRDKVGFSELCILPSIDDTYILNTVLVSSNYDNSDERSRGSGRRGGRKPFI